DFFDLAINQIAKTGLSSLQVIYYFESLFSTFDYGIKTTNNAGGYTHTENEIMFNWEAVR
ncbi:hypothetical protein KKJ13_02065, partial [Xenorhabdus bovienii]|uniref:hypothetical protein n=1 Tax=Xenorhabdus bovienii TaxID=40576 RepID=UPI0023B29A89